MISRAGSPTIWITYKVLQSKLIPNWLQFFVERQNKENEFLLWT